MLRVAAVVVVFSAICHASSRVEETNLMALRSKAAVVESAMEGAADASWKRNLVEYLQIGFVAFVIVFGFIRPFVIEPYKIPSGSMEDTLLVGDRVLVIKFLYGVKLPGTNRRLFSFREPQRGDVFVFAPKHDARTHFIKRVVAVEGDTLETRGRTLIVNGTPLVHEPYVKHLDAMLPDFPPFQYPLVPFFFETPGIQDAVRDFASRRPVEEVQVRDGLPVAFTIPSEGEFLVRYVRERGRPLPVGESGVEQYFLMDAQTVSGQMMIRAILYQHKPTGQWYLSERLDPAVFRERFPGEKPFVVPEGCFFGMGDNRENSADARAWGPIPFDVVKGKAIMVYWSTNADGGLNPLTRIRWNRIGKIIKRQYGTS
jgi:signal peptidase I